MTENERNEYLAKEFNKGSKLYSLGHLSSMGEKVKLKEIDRDLLPYVDETVLLLTPVRQLSRELIYMHIEELISLVQEEEIQRMDAKLVAIVKGILLGLDYLTHEKFIDGDFTEEDKNELNQLLVDSCSFTCTRTFSEDANRPVFHKATLLQDDEGVYCLDQREERTRLYMAVVYKKTNLLQEKMSYLAINMNQIALLPETKNRTLEESINGKTDHDLDAELLYQFNQLRYTLSWLLHSYSWRKNELSSFDEMDVQIKLGLSR